MNTYVTGAAIKRLRQERSLTQSALAEQLQVSDKTISKWETGKGYPDITLVEPLAKALGVSVVELLSGNDVTNGNRSANMLRSVLYVCPICGNVIAAAGEAVVCCCGLTLPVCEAQPMDEAHQVHIDIVEDEYFVSSAHEMTRDHHFSFFAAVQDNGLHLVKLYPEGNAEARFKMNRTRLLYAYCNHHGLYQMDILKWKLAQKQ